MTTRKPLQRHFRALALEPRILLDAAAVTTATEVATQADALATVDAPGVEATPVKATVTIDGNTSSFAPVDLFENVSVSRNEDYELIDLVITVDRAGSNQALVIDGKTIQLVAGSGTTQADDGFSYKVTVTGSTTTITVNIDGYTNDVYEVQKLIDGLAYQVQGNTVESGTVTITLESLSDDDEQVTDLSAIKATIEIDNKLNIAPVLTGEALKQAEFLNSGTLAGSTQITYSNDGKHVYAAGANNSISVFSVDESGRLILQQSLSDITNLGKSSQMVASADGKSLYSISGNGTIVHLLLNSDGTLKSYENIATGNGNATGGLAISDDGKQLYVGSKDNGLVVYNRGTDSGALTYLQNFDGRSPVVFTAGNYVYVLNIGAYFMEDDSLTVYERTASGHLGVYAKGLDTGKSGTNTPNAYSFAVSADGKHIYIGDPTSDSDDNIPAITVYHLNGKELSKSNSLDGKPIAALSLSQDGKSLTALTGTGELNIYSVDGNGALTLLSSRQSSVTNARDMAIASDGRGILVSGNGLDRYTSIQTVISGDQVALANSLTLRDANFDRLANGNGDYNGGKLLITRAGGASNHDVFGFATANGLTLKDGQIIKGDQAIATFNQSAGTLTVTFLEGTSRTDANAVLHQVTYSNTSSDANGSVVTLQLRANDGQADSQVISLDVLLTNNTPPELTTTPATAGTYDTTGKLAPLFKDTAISTGEAGQSIIQITFNLGGLDKVANEFIIVAGTRIDLSKSGSGNAGDYRYTYTLDGNNASLVIDSDGTSAAAAQTLVNEMAYVNDTTQATSATRTVTLTSIRDNGGSAAGGSDTGEPGIVASIALAINNAPQWEAEVSDPDRTLYYTDGTLNGYADRVTDIVVSTDGKTLAISGSTGENAAGTSYLRIYSRDTTTGELTLVQTFTQGVSDNPDTTAIEANGLNAITSMAMHGNNLYLAGNTGDATVYSLVRFTYDASTGQYNYAGIVATQGSNCVAGLDAQVSEIVISADGKSLYTINGVSTIDGPTNKSVLAQFSIDPQSGALTYLGTYLGGSADLGMNAPSGIVVSPDGTSVYVANSKNSMISVFSRDTQSGVLTYSSFINRTTIAADTDSAVQPDDDRYLLELQDIVISPDGKHVYVGSGQQSTVSVFSRDAANGSLTYVSTLELYPHVMSLNIREIAMSSDGSAIYVGFNGGPLVVLSRDSVTGAVAFVSALNTGARSNQIAVTPDGLNIYTGRSQFTAGVSILSALPNASYIVSRPSTPFAEGISFSDPDFDTADNYQGTELTISRNDTPSANDLFGFKADAGLSLVGNQIMQNGTAIAEFTSADGTLSIRFTAEVDKATANQVLQQVTYRNDSAEAPARVDLKLTIGDGGKSTETTLALLRAPTTPDPTLTASGQQTSITIGTGSLPNPVDLFRQVEVFLDDDGEPLTDLLITVDRIGDDQALVIDGETITLLAGSGQTSANGYQYVVEENDGVTSIRIDISSSANGATPEATATLIDGIAYKVLADTASTGTVTITLASLSDTSDQIEPGISASVIVRDQRQLPTLGAEPGSLQFGEFSFELEDGKSLYGGIKSIVTEGDKVYALSETSEFGELPSGEWGYTYTTTLFIFERGADGKLVLIDSIAGSDANGLEGTLSLGLSNDDQVLHVLTNNGATLFSRDPATGTLTLLGTLADTGMEFIRDVQTQGEFLYVSGGDSLKVYQRQGAEWVERDSETPDDALAQFSALQVSPDGSFLYAGLMGGSSLVSVFRIGADGALSWVNDIQGSNSAEFYDASKLMLSADGKSLYVVETIAPEVVDGSLGEGEQQGTGRLHVLGVATDGNLTAIEAIELDSSAEAVALSPDSNIVAILRGQGLSKVIELYSRSADGSLVHLTSVEEFGDPNAFDSTAEKPAYISLRDARSIAFSADGKQLYVSSQINWSDAEYNYYGGDGILVLELEPAEVTFTERGEPIALLPAGTLADPQLDAAGDYEGSSLVIERNGGAQDGDAFTFLNENGLELKDDGKIWKGETAIAEFVEANGKLTITFLAGVSKADAQRVLRQVAYASSSNDPTRNGDTAGFHLVFNDGDGNNSSMDASVTLVGINDAAIVETTPLNPTFTTGGDSVNLFKDTHIDTIEQGQTIHRVEVTITGVKADDVLNVLGDQIDLNQAVDSQAYVGEGENRVQYAVRVNNGVTVVSLYMGRDSGPGRGGVETAQIINNLSYSHTGSESAGNRTVALTLFENVPYGHPEPGNERSTFAEQTTVTLEAPRPVSDTELPELKATGTRTQLEVVSNDLPEAVDLFSDVTVLAGNDGEPLTALTLTVNRSGADQALIIDGQEIRLEATDMAQTGANGYSYSVTINADGSASVKIFIDSSAADNPADVERLVDGMAYKVLSSTVADGNVVVTLTGISDYDDTTLDISASIAVSHESGTEPVNTPPTAQPGSYALTQGTAGQGYSVVLPEQLFNDADGDQLVWSIDGTLPAGLAFDVATRTISGIPASSGDTALTIRVTDPSGASAEIQLTLHIQAASTEPNPDPGTDPGTNPDPGSNPGNGSNTDVTPQVLPLDHFIQPQSRAAEAESNSRFPELLSAAEPALPARPATVGAPMLSRGTTPGHEAAAEPTTARATLAVLDAIHAQHEAESAAPAYPLQLADGRSSPLVVLASDNGAAFQAQRSTVAGPWQRDLAANRMVFQLPAGLVSSRIAIASLELRDSHGRLVSPSVRLDLESASIIATGQNAKAMDLRIVVRTVDGQSLTIPVHIDAAGTAFSRPANTASDEAGAASFAAKPALSEQLHHSASSNLLAQAQALLERLSSGPVTAEDGEAAAQEPASTHAA